MQRRGQQGGDNYHETTALALWDWWLRNVLKITLRVGNQTDHRHDHTHTHTHTHTGRDRDDPCSVEMAETLVHSERVDVPSCFRRSCSWAATASATRKKKTCKNPVTTTRAAGYMRKSGGWREGEGTSHHAPPKTTTTTKKRQSQSL